MSSFTSSKNDVKLCFIGERYVGKTAIILSLTNADDLEQMHGPSVVKDNEEAKTNKRRKSLQSPDTVSRNYKLPFSTS